MWLRARSRGSWLGQITKYCNLTHVNSSIRNLLALPAPYLFLRPCRLFMYRGPSNIVTTEQPISRLVMKHDNSLRHEK
jgi:hypothetical protein